MNFENNLCQGIIEINNDTIKITGYLKQNVKKLSYIAAMPADKHCTFTGSGLPYTDPVQAFENTINHGYIKINNNMFVIYIKNPNSYYINLGTTLIPPTIYFTYENFNNNINTVEVIVNNPIPFRSLTYENGQFTIPRDSANFYEIQGPLLPICTQEKILRSAGYPVKTRKISYNFWSSKPPL